MPRTHSRCQGPDSKPGLSGCKALWASRGRLKPGHEFLEGWTWQLHFIQSRGPIQGARLRSQFPQRGCFGLQAQPCGSHVGGDYGQVLPLLPASRHPRLKGLCDDCGIADVTEPTSHRAPCPSSTGCRAGLTHTWRLSQCVTGSNPSSTTSWVTSVKVPSPPRASVSCDL